MTTIHRLHDLQTVEVSLVGKGANRKRHALFKQEQPMKPTAEVMKAAVVYSVIKSFAGPMKSIDEVKKALADMKADARKKVIDAIKLLASVGPDLGDGVLNDFVSSLGVESAGDLLAAMEGGPAETPSSTVTGEEPTPEETMMNADANKSEAKLPATAQAQIQKAEAAAAAANAAVAIEKTERAKLEKALAVERDARLDREFLSKAEKLPALGLKPAELGALLKRLSAVDEKLANELIEKVLAPANTKASKVDELLKEIGRAPKGEGDGLTADEKIQKAAEELRKANPKLTAAQAEVEVTKAHPELYEQSEAERRERVRNA